MKKVRLYNPYARVRPCVPCVSRVCPGSPRCLFTGSNTAPTPAPEDCCPLCVSPLVPNSQHQRRTIRGSPMGEGRSLVGNKNSDSESDDVEAVEERPWRQLLWHKGRDPCVAAPE